MTSAISLVSIEANAELTSLIGGFSVDGPEVAVNQAPAIVIRPPLTGKAGTVAGNDPNKLQITGTPRVIQSAYPLYLGIQDFP